MSDVETDTENAPLTDKDVAAYLNAHAVAARLVYPDTPTPTVADAAEALGVSSERIVKSLVFIADEAPYLVIAAGEARVSQKRLRDVLGVSRRKLRMASPEEAFAVSGFEVGAMPPFGHRQPLPTLLDTLTVPTDQPDKTIVYAGGGSKAAMVELSVATLLAVAHPKTVPLTTSADD